jgi:hypothetical protein
MADNAHTEDPERRNGDQPDERPKAGEKPYEFQRFEDLTRKLAKVPKRELDAKRKAS